MRLNNLEFVKSYLVVKAFLLNQINKAHPIGHVSHRSTGDWKKVSANQWVKVKRKGEKEDTGAAIPKKSVDLSNEKERYNFAKGLAEDYEAGKLPDKLNKLIDAEKGELLGEDTIADAISNLLESKENKSAIGISIFDSPEFERWAKKRGLKVDSKSKMEENKENILKYESAKEELNNLTKKLDKQIKTQLPNTETAQLRKKWNDARINYREKLLKVYPTKEKWNEANPDKAKEENNQYYDEQIVKMLSRLKKLKAENKI